MSEQERELREYLGRIVSGGPRIVDTIQAISLLALLDRRVMPAPDEVPERVIVEMLDAFARKPSIRDAMRAAYRALYDHYHQPPKPKKVEVWHIAYTDGTSEFSTDWGFIEALHGDLSVSRIVHLREVEADQ